MAPFIFQKTFLHNYKDLTRSCKAERYYNIIILILLLIFLAFFTYIIFIAFIFCFIEL